jgi:predicted nucleic acid-binding protein
VKSFVVDASVAAKWFLPAAGEPLTREAEELLGSYLREQIRLLVPDLFWTELGNVLWKAVLRTRITQQHAQKSIAKALQLPLRVLPAIDLISQAMELALASGRSVYDSLYIAAAMSQGVELLTADERLANATGLRFPVRWLGALSGIV